MYKNFDPHKSYFHGVALSIIIIGASIATIGTVEWISNMANDSGFSSPALKVIGGLIILALGYVQIEIELLRLQGAEHHKSK